DRMVEPCGLYDLDTRRDTVSFGVVVSRCHGDRIDVARDGGDVRYLGCRNGEDAGAATDIEHGFRPAPLEDPVEREQAAARGRVMRRAEGKPGVDFQCARLT